MEIFYSLLIFVVRGLYIDFVGFKRFVIVGVLGIYKIELNGRRIGSKGNLFNNCNYDVREGDILFLWFN